MRIPSFTLNRQFQEIGSEIEGEVFKVLKGGQYIGGQEIAKFEESFSNLIGVKNTIGCNSGTDALVLACLLYTSPSPRDTALSSMPSSA